MQTKKDDIEQQIAKAAKAIFLKKGFAQTSMREIAEKAGVGLSNIYNYYAGKDDLFRAIVAPLTGEFKRLLQTYHNPLQIDITKQWMPEMTEKTAAEYNQIMLKYRDLLTLLLFKSAGSSLARFKEDFTDEATGLMLNYMDAMKQRYPALKWDFSPFFIHTYTDGGTALLGCYRNAGMATANVSKALLRNTLKLSAYGRFDCANNGAFFIRFNADYHLTDEISLTAGYDWFRADAGMFAMYKDNSEIWVKVHFGF